MRCLSYRLAMTSVVAPQLRVGEAQSVAGGQRTQVERGLELDLECVQVAREEAPRMQALAPGQAVELAGHRVDPVAEVQRREALRWVPTSAAYPSAQACPWVAPCGDMSVEAPRDACGAEGIDRRSKVRRDQAGRLDEHALCHRVDRS